MGADYTGALGLPIPPEVAAGLTVEEVNRISQQDFGPSPEEAQRIMEEAARERKMEAERKRLAQVEAAARQANIEAYSEGGIAYGTVPGGPDVSYIPSTAPLPAKILFPALDPFYGEGGVFEPVTNVITGEGDTRSNLLLYGALAIGTLALLRR